MRALWPGLALLAVVGAAFARGPETAGRRLSAKDITIAVAGLEARTFVPVNPEFDYTSCSGFPRPMDLRCDLLAQGGFDAEGRQYAVRYTNSEVSSILMRTEIWRTSLDGGTELVAFLEPRAHDAGSYDDGRIEKIAVDPVQGYLYAVLATSCFPPSPDNCSYSSRTNEIVRIVGLRTLSDVLNGPDPTAVPPPGGAGSSNPGVVRIQSRPADPDEVAAPGGRR